MFYSKKKLCFKSSIFRIIAWTNKMLMRKNSKIPVCLTRCSTSSSWLKNLLKHSVHVNILSLLEVDGATLWSWDDASDSMVVESLIFFSFDLTSFESIELLLWRLGFFLVVRVSSFDSVCWFFTKAVGSSFEWVFFMWFLRNVLCVNRFSQTGHSYGFSPINNNINIFKISRFTPNFRTILYLLKWHFRVLSLNFRSKFRTG